MKPLESNEEELIGSWIVKDGHVVKDDVTLRIEWLVAHTLQRLASDATGWDTLYRDPPDGRFWELIYPQSELHGGGPPLLRNVAPGDAREKYNWS